MTNIVYILMSFLICINNFKLLWPRLPNGANKQMLHVHVEKRHIFNLTYKQQVLKGFVMVIIC